jgi:hypothetical protein
MGNAGAAEAEAMGGSYELVRTDDAAGHVLDLEAGRCAAVYPKGGGGGGGIAPPPVPSPPSSPASARQRLVSLDVFRGITVLVRAEITPFFYFVKKNLFLFAGMFFLRLFCPLKISTVYSCKSLWLFLA